ncbi:MAG TPA: hypothetical protein VNV16_11850 [Methylibium sp.]|nr:hypothetical protein [Methylibium sp.]
MSAEPYAALKRAKEEEPHFPSSYWGNKSPRCPHCGEECDVSENGWWGLYEEGEHEKTCPHCDGDFTISTHVSYSFNTDKQPGAHAQERLVRGGGS